MIAVALLVVCIAATNKLAVASPTGNTVPECSDALLYLEDINTTAASNYVASNLLLAKCDATQQEIELLQTKIDSSTSALSIKADLSLQGTASLSLLAGIINCKLRTKLMNLLVKYMP